MTTGADGEVEAGRTRDADGMANVIDVGGSGAIKVGKAEGESIAINLGGSGDLKVAEGSARKLSATIGGSGTIAGPGQV